MTETLLGIEYRDEDWPHGLRCARCDRLFLEPERYTEQLDGFTDDIPMLRIVCLDCALRGPDDVPN